MANRWRLSGLFQWATYRQKLATHLKSFLKRQPTTFSEGLFKELYEESFPSASPELRARFRSFLAQEHPEHKWLYAPSPKPHLSQGDIFCCIPAFHFDGKSARTTKDHYPAILLENTCNMSMDEAATRRNTYVAAPLFPYDLVAQYFKDPSGVRKNLITHKIFFSSIPGLDKPYVADLNMMLSVGATWLHEAIADKTVSRMATLSDEGYYFLLAKLTVHMLRAEV